MNRPRRWSAIRAGAAALGVVLALWSGGLLNPLQRSLEELNAGLLERRVASDVLIVAIDARSLKDIDRWPWSRDVHARLLSRLHAAQPRAVFLDIDFSVRAADAAADRTLAEALAHPRDYPVILPAFWQTPSVAEAASRVLTRPLPALAESASVGLVNLAPGPGGLVREVVHAERFGARRYASASALLAGREDLTPGRAYPVDFSLSPRSFDYVSYADVLAGRVPDARIAGRTVLVGAGAVELGDNVPVPVHRTLPGVIVQALAYQTLREGIPRVAPPWAVGASLCCWLGVWAWLRRWGWRGQLAGSAAGLFAGWLGALYLQGNHGLLWNPAPWSALIVVGLFAGLAAAADRETWMAWLARMRLVRERALISGVLSASIDGILVVDAGGLIRDVNAAAAAMLGSGRRGLLGRRIEQVLRLDAGGLEPGRREIEAVGAAGLVPVELSVSLVDGDPDGLRTLIVRDATERRRQQALLRHQATHDSLTGLPNRALLESRLAALAEGEPAALFMLDLDGFKRINDTLGHRAGDQVLRQLGTRLRDLLPDVVRVFRLGGDEFAVLVHGATRGDALHVLAAEILCRVRTPVEVDGNRLEVGGSIGIAVFPQHAGDGDALLQCADVAMYAAKRARSGVEVYDPAADHNTLRNLRMTGALRDALAEDRLSLVYQPKIRLSDGVCVGVEALVRWHDPELGVVRPDEFIPLAEACDLIDPLTRFTLARALRDHARWCARGLEVDVAVNLSARHLARPDFADEIIELVERQGLLPQRLELEITETALMEDPERARHMLRRLTDRGVRLAMDDFGTGFSSLAYLKHLNLHALKIDRCFVSELTRQARDRAIVGSTLEMAHALGLEVVAEGIENTDQLQLLRQMGCDVGQGFGIARPMPADELVDWLGQRRQQPPARPRSA